jgi:hypothetical protein
MTDRSAAMQEAYWLAWFNVPVAAIYAAAQAAVSFMLAREHVNLKLVIEPHLLLLGVILHVHWRRVDRIHRELEISKPWWMSAADCLSFVVTFWALATLGEAFLRAAKLI